MPRISYTPCSYTGTIDARRLPLEMNLLVEAFYIHRVVHVIVGAYVWTCTCCPDVAKLVPLL